MEDQLRRSPWTRRALLGGALLFPAVYVPRVLLGLESARRPPQTFRGHLLVVTFGALPAGSLMAFEGPLARWRARSLSIAPVFADAELAESAAASLLCGTRTWSHGVRAAGDVVQPDRWNLVRSARAAGHATFAIGCDDLAQRLGDVGFDETEVAVDEVDAAERACALIAARRDAHLFVWLHLPAPSGSPRGVVAAFQSVLHAIESNGTVDRTALLVSALRGVTGQAEDLLDVPVVLQLPGAKGHGPRLRSHLALSDVAPGIASSLRLPDANSLGLLAPLGRGASFVSTATGGPIYETVCCEGSFGMVVRAAGPSGTWPGVRALVPAGSELRAENATIALLPDAVSASNQLQKIGPVERSYAEAVLARELPAYR